MMTMLEILNLAASIVQLVTAPLIGVTVLVVLFAPKIWAKSVNSGRDLVIRIPAKGRKVIAILLVTAVVAYVVDLADHFGLKLWAEQKVSLTEVRDKAFRNQEVIPDGKNYFDSTFDNVTFVLN